MDPRRHALPSNSIRPAKICIMRWACSDTDFDFSLESCAVWRTSSTVVVVWLTADAVSETLTPVARSMLKSGSRNCSKWSRPRSNHRSAAANFRSSAGNSWPASPPRPPRAAVTDVRRQIPPPAIRSVAAARFHAAAWKCSARIRKSARRKKNERLRMFRRSWKARARQRRLRRFVHSRLSAGRFLRSPSPMSMSEYRPSPLCHSSLMSHCQVAPSPRACSSR